MNSSNAKANVVTVLLDKDALNYNLAHQILDDCQRSGVPSSYRTTVSEIFNRSDVAPELLGEDGCLVVPLPGVTSSLVQETTKSPSAVVIRNQRGEGKAFLQLRGEKILVAAHELCKSQLTSRYLVLYLFEDCLALDMIRATRELEEEIWVHEMSAQSPSPFAYEPLPDSEKNAFQPPIVAMRIITVTEGDDTSEGDASHAPPTVADSETLEQTGDTEGEWLDDIPF
ncbi:hypothetical protein [Paraburkholderia caribensis]|uniref:hypothetical protein n=1 Tax=Paraburkholderia caribensis TaxID=75105 RepID=UPI00078BD737|nr:hypothetical protein [Paraburkholderia caribensis]AMV48205.1 hypothetical protein ATN79_46925 [Paraburkholderia caribensis]